jgi:hypothetical protein
MAQLNDLMEFDVVVQVLPGGKVIEAPKVYGPSLHEDELDDQSWSLMDGYSGQDRYSGPIMHASEFVGGQMERDILSEPGYYVTLVNYLDEGEPEGWAVAYRSA